MTSSAIGACVFQSVFYAFIVFIINSFSLKGMTKFRFTYFRSDRRTILSLENEFSEKGLMHSHHECDDMEENKNELKTEIDTENRIDTENPKRKP